MTIRTSPCTSESSHPSLTIPIFLLIWRVPGAAGRRWRRQWSRLSCLIRAWMPRHRSSAFWRRRLPATTSASAWGERRMHVSVCLWPVTLRALEPIRRVLHTHIGFYMAGSQRQSCLTQSACSTQSRCHPCRPTCSPSRTGCAWARTLPGAFQTSSTLPSAEPVSNLPVA